jgi:hypothetical protein
MQELEGDGCTKACLKGGGALLHSNKQEDGNVHSRVVSFPLLKTMLHEIMSDMIQICNRKE